MVSLGELKSLAFEARKDIDEDALRMLSQYPSTEQVYMLTRKLKTAAEDRNKSLDVLVASVEQADPDSLLLRTSIQGHAGIKTELERISRDLRERFSGCDVHVTVEKKKDNHTVLVLTVEARLSV